MLVKLIGFETALYLFIMFWFFSFLGWIVEILSFIIEDRKLVNRGFLIGPYCPLYGFGALIMLAISYISDDLFIIFLLTMIACSILEYFASYIMEILFQVRWWDYSNRAFNINGRICLRSTIFFGLLGVVFLKVLLPWYDGLIESISYNSLLIIAIIVFIITLIDILVSFNAMSSIKSVVEKSLKDYQNKDATMDVKKMVNEKVPGANFLQNRLIKTYHLLSRQSNRIIKSVNKRPKNGFELFTAFIIVGVIIGLVFSLWFKLASYKLIVPFSLSVSSLIAAIILKVGDK